MSRFIILLAFAVLAAGCVSPPGGEARDYASLAQNLKEQRADVAEGEQVEQPFFSVKGRILLVNGIAVQVFEYTDEAAANSDASEVAPDGSAIGTTIVSWIDTPHFYKNGKLIVLYVGNDQNTLSLLENALGKPFAEGPKYVPGAILTFDDCAAAGYPVMESYPRQCRTPDGRTFVSQKDVFDINRNDSCASDVECILVNEERGFSCCWAGACERIDYSMAVWIAVNTDWFTNGKSVNCPSEEECGPAPGCAAQSINENYSAKCVDKRCRKVPDACTSDAQCGEGMSCWYRLPAGPGAGEKGSPGRPGKCWDDDVVSAIVSPAGDADLKKSAVTSASALSAGALRR
jgi:hypothetical protein